MARQRTLIARNPSEARGIRKAFSALRAAGVKFKTEFKSAGKRKAKRNPTRKKKRKLRPLNGTRRSTTRGRTVRRRRR